MNVILIYIIKIKDDNICGFCKNLKESYPYKIINKKFCIKDKPKNTYFLNEKNKILNFCHYSC